MSSLKTDQDVIQVLMVCLGNICRSPTAEGVFQQLVNNAGLASSIKVESAGTGGYHIGAPPDKRSRLAATNRGYNLDSIRSRKVRLDDFSRFHYILAMDHENLVDLKRICPPSHQHKIQLFLQYSNRDEQQVPDPYFSATDGFEQVLDLIEDAAENLLRHIIINHFPDKQKQ